MEFSNRRLQITGHRLQIKTLGLVAVFAVAALAQAPGVASIRAPRALAAAAHGTAIARFTISIQPGFHIQSNHPKLDYLIPTSLTLTPADGVAVEKVAWPAAKDHTFSFSPNQPLAVFEGTFAVPVTLKTGAPGTATLRGSFRYQACNDELCKPPVTVPISLTVHVR